MIKLSGFPISQNPNGIYLIQRDFAPENLIYSFIHRIIHNTVLNIDRLCYEKTKSQLDYLNSHWPTDKDGKKRAEKEKIMYEARLSELPQLLANSLYFQM